MTQNEVLQWTLAGIIVLAAIIWAVVRVIAFSRKKEGGDCGCCGEAGHCKARNLKEEIRRRQSCDCHDGQSARN